MFILYPRDLCGLHACITKPQCDGLEKAARSGVRLLPDPRSPLSSSPHPSLPPCCGIDSLSETKPLSHRDKPASQGYCRYLNMKE